ncbi:MAG: hypothetical protein ACFFDF_17065 [Candidatus Odinarchaeota archaeon]
MTDHDRKMMNQVIINKEMRKLKQEQYDKSDEAKYKRWKKRYKKGKYNIPNIV